MESFAFKIPSVIWQMYMMNVAHFPNQKTLSFPCQRVYLLESNQKSTGCIGCTNTCFVFACYQCWQAIHHQHYGTSKMVVDPLRLDSICCCWDRYTFQLMNIDMECPWMSSKDNKLCCIKTIGLLCPGWWFQPLWKILVTWDYYYQYMGK